MDWHWKDALIDHSRKVPEARELGGFFTLRDKIPYTCTVQLSKEKVGSQLWQNSLTLQFKSLAGARYGS